MSVPKRGFGWQPVGLAMGLAICLAGGPPLSAQECSQSDWMCAYLDNFQNGPNVISGAYCGAKSTSGSVSSSSVASCSELIPQTQSGGNVTWNSTELTQTLNSSGACYAPYSAPGYTVTGAYAPPLFTWDDYISGQGGYTGATPAAAPGTVICNQYAGWVTRCYASNGAYVPGAPVDAPYSCVDVVTYSNPPTCDCGQPSCDPGTLGWTCPSEPDCGEDAEAQCVDGQYQCVSTCEGECCESDDPCCLSDDCCTMTNYEEEEGCCDSLGLSYSSCCDLYGVACGDE
jgi:hypothetical protein